MPQTNPLTPTLRFNATAGRYIGSSGRFVSAATVRAELDTALDRAEKGVAAATDALRAGTSDVATWQLLMAREVKSVHLASAALAKGGWAQMAPADYGRAGQRIREQYAFLANFAAEVVDGRQRLDGTLVRRAAMYVQSGRGTFHATERQEQGRRGMTEERNLLGAADHCEGCLEEDARGWVGIGELVPIGARICRTNCRCSISYR